MKLVGCSGFSYDDWRGVYYPEDISKEEWLGYYSQDFNSLEINRSFYQLPSESVLQDWYAQTSVDFRFTFKGSRYVTHMKKLADCKGAVKKVYQSAQNLENKLACILWQLPGMLKKDLSRLKEFIGFLSSDFRHAFEFRHASWWDEEVISLLNSKEQIFVSVSSPDPTLPRKVIRSGEAVYIRFHGEGQDWYDYAYHGNRLNHWLSSAQDKAPKNLMIYFNNDIKANAPFDARKIARKIF